MSYGVLIYYFLHCMIFCPQFQYKWHSPGCGNCSLTDNNPCFHSKYECCGGLWRPILEQATQHYVGKTCNNNGRNLSDYETSSVNVVSVEVVSFICLLSVILYYVFLFKNFKSRIQHFLKRNLEFNFRRHLR